MWNKDLVNEWKKNFLLLGKKKKEKKEKLCFSCSLGISLYKVLTHGVRRSRLYTRKKNMDPKKEEEEESSLSSEAAKKGSGHSNILSRITLKKSFLQLGNLLQKSFIFLYSRGAAFSLIFDCRIFLF